MDSVKEKSEFNKNLIIILKGSIYSIIISLICMLIFAILLCYTSLKENIMIPVIFVVTGISILIGSMLSTKKAKKNGLLKGGIIGIIYIMFLYFLSSLFLANFSLNLNSFIMIIISFFTGIIGGIIGINFKK